MLRNLCGLVLARESFKRITVTPTQRCLSRFRYLQYFCGYKAFDDSKPPFAPSMMVYFRKCLTSEIIGGIKEMIIAAEQDKAEKVAEEAEDSDDDKNSGTMIVDATYAPSQITYPL